MKFNNERDIEIPAILEFINSYPVNTLLDVGAHWSHAFYAPEVRKLVKNYDALDILPDPLTAKIVNKYWQKNVLDFNAGKYDMVISISSIEHAGITTYQVEDYKTEQLAVFCKILDLAKKYVLLTFPYGKEALHEGQFANITKEQLDKFIDRTLNTEKIFMDFYFSESPVIDKIPYRKVDKEFADNVEYLREQGTRCFCILHIVL